jgi:hypothetical protein
MRAAGLGRITPVALAASRIWRNITTACRMRDEDTPSATFAPTHAWISDGFNAPTG